MLQSNCCSLHQSSVDARARRAAHQVELIARKSSHVDPIGNLGEFMLVDFQGVPQAGFQYDLSAEEVIEFCAQYS